MSPKLTEVKPLLLFTITHTYLVYAKLHQFLINSFSVLGQKTHRHRLSPWHMEQTPAKIIPALKTTASTHVKIIFSNAVYAATDMNVHAACISLLWILLITMWTLSVTDLFTDVVTGDADEVQYRVHVPRVIRRVLLGQNCNFQHLHPNRKLQCVKPSTHCPRSRAINMSSVDRHQCSWPVNKGSVYQA